MLRMFSKPLVGAVRRLHTMATHDSIMAQNQFKKDIAKRYPGDQLSIRCLEKAYDSLNEKGLIKEFLSTDIKDMFKVIPGIFPPIAREDDRFISAIKKNDDSHTLLTMYWTVENLHYIAGLTNVCDKDVVLDEHSPQVGPR